MVRRKVLGMAAGAGAVLVVATMPMALATGNPGEGARKSGLAPVTPSSANQCPSSTGTQTDGFAILNSAGRAEVLQGEVAVKNVPSTTYAVEVVQNGSCPRALTTLTTNAEGNGNAHLSGLTLPSGGSYHVFLKKLSGAGPDLASAPVTLG